MSKKRAGSEYWIVTRFSFHEHASAEAANTEADRLRGLFPDKHFRVIRCKRNPKASPDKIAMGGQILEMRKALHHARSVIVADVRSVLESHCIPDRKTMEPDRGTIDDIGAAELARLEPVLAEIDAALAEPPKGETAC